MTQMEQLTLHFQRCYRSSSSKISLRPHFTYQWYYLLNGRAVIKNRNTSMNTAIGVHLLT